jgi:K+-transporting ATPase KdpF subunit
MRSFGVPARRWPPPSPFLCPPSAPGIFLPTSRARPANMIWFVGLLTAALFVYLFYALIKPEKF